MGSPASEKGHFEDESLHQVHLNKGYWLADTSCTQALWQAVMENNSSDFEISPDHPVDSVSWDDTQDFIQRTNALLADDFQTRLPTETEWERACRAGTDTAFNWGDQISTEQANYRGRWDIGDPTESEYRGKTLPVRSFEPNSWGFYQMHGNVWEWCHDWYGDYPASMAVSPQGPAEGQRRLVRGGSWANDGRLLRSAYRNYGPPDYRYRGTGLRLAGG